MTDYKEPTTAAEAIDEQASELKYREQKYRSDAALLLAKADEARDIAWNLQTAADHYRKWQPKTKADVATCTVPTCVLVAGHTGRCEQTS